MERSKKAFEEAQRFIPGGVNSPVRAFKAVGGNPVFIERGAGSKIYDIDGNEYVDWILGLGPLTLGYSHPVINDAIRRQLTDGILFSLPHKLEAEVAEMLCEVIP